MRYVLFGVISLVIFLVLEPLDQWVLMWLCYLLLVLVFLAIRVRATPMSVLSSTRRLSRAYAQIGQPVTVNVAVSWQAGAGPGWVQVQDTLPQTMSALAPCGHLTTIGGDNATTFSYRVAGRQRGFYPIGPLRVTVGDLFGLTQGTAESTDTEYLTVYPRVVSIPRLRLSSNRPIGEATSTKRIYEDPTRITGVREYAPGDTLSKIHWKTTARLGTLMTKLYEPSTSIEVHILLNLFDADYLSDKATVELACTTAASVATSLLDEKHLVGLQTNGYDQIWPFRPPTTFYGVEIQPQKGESQAAAILSTLGRLLPVSQPSLAIYLEYVQTRLPWTASLLLITHLLTEESAMALESLKRRGFELAVIIVGSGENANISRIRAAALHLLVAIVHSEKELGQLAFWQPGRD